MNFKDEYQTWDNGIRKSYGGYVFHNLQCKNGTGYGGMKVMIEAKIYDNGIEQP